MSDRKLKLQVVFEAVDRAVSKMTGIQKSATKVGKALAVARAEQKELNKIQGDVTSFRKLKTAVVENSKKLEEAQSKVAKLANAMKQAEKPTRDMERAFNRAKREAGELDEKIDRDSQSLQRLRDRLKESGVNTRDLASAQRDLKSKLEASTKEVDKQRQAYADLAKHGKTPGSKTPGDKKSANGPGSFTDKAVKAGLIMGTIRELGDILAGPAIADAKAEDQMTQIGIKANLSREHLVKMRAEIDRLAPQVRKTNEELRGGVDFLAASGLDPRAALKMLEPIGKASHAYKAEIEDLAQATNAALTNLKIPLGKGDIDRTRMTARILEIMAQAGKDGNFEFNDMARNFPTLTARLSSLGQTGVKPVADLSAALQIAWKATGNAEQAANNIDNLLLKINAKETIDNFKKFGVDLPAAMKKAYAEGKGPLEAIAELTQKATGGNTDKLSYIFADAQAQTGVLSLIQNLKEYQRIRDNTLSSSTQGLIDRDFARVANDTASRWEKLIAGWTVLKDTLGSNMRSVTNAAIASADWLITAATANDVKAKSVKIGNDVGDGLALGLMQRRGKVVAAADSLAKAMPDKVRQNLQVKSPSRVFMAIGRHAADGLALGIDGNRHGPARAAGRMAAGVLAAGSMSLAAGGPAMARPGGMAAPTASPAPITIHVHAAPGMDVKELAREVRRELEAAQAQKARASYADDH